MTLNFPSKKQLQKISGFCHCSCWWEIMAVHWGWVMSWSKLIFMKWFGVSRSTFILFHMKFKRTIKSQCLLFSLLFLKKMKFSPYNLRSLFVGSDAAWRAKWRKCLWKMIEINAQQSNKSWSQRWSFWRLQKEVFLSRVFTNYQRKDIRRLDRDQSLRSHWHWFE